MSEANVLVIAGSVRTDSFNRKLAQLAASQLEEFGAKVTRLDLRDFALPIYNGDLEAQDGVPSAAVALHEQFRTHGRIFIASPEYNSNVSPLIINSLAWISRVQEHGGMRAAFGTPVFALGSASPGGFGGYRGLMSLRNTLELGLNARVLGSMVSVGSAHKAFDQEGNLRIPIQQRMLPNLLSQLLATAPTV